MTKNSFLLVYVIIRYYPGCTFPTIETILRAPVLITDLYLKRDFGISGITFASFMPFDNFLEIGISLDFLGRFKL